MPHPLVDQLRFTRHEFKRALGSLNQEDSCKRLFPMNSISWNVGHLAWQEQKYFLWYGTNQILFPQIERDFAYGCPASTPPLKETLAAWQKITAAVDLWLDDLTGETIAKPLSIAQRETTFGNLLLRTIYHYWYHIGENMAIRQQLGHGHLPVFVGNLERQAPYRPE